MRHLVLPLALSVLSVPFALHAQKVSARDAFWSASDLVSVSANPGAKRSARAVAPRPKPSTTSSTPAHLAPQLIAENGYGEQPHLVRTSAQTQQIGLRYSLLLRGADDTFHEVSPKAVFHAGDHLRLSIMSNEPGYLYVIQQGTSGSWSPIFPGTGAGPDANRIEAGSMQQVPGPTQAFQFDTTPGTEKLFVVLSRERIDDLDQAIQRLRNPSPASESIPQPRPAGEMLEASNHIPDELVQRLVSRDLTLVTEQKVDQKESEGGSGEKAVYVVAKHDTSAPAHEVVARITLNHQ